MTRRAVRFACEGNDLIGSIDTPGKAGDGGDCGLLIVSGGNEVRAGPWNSQAQLAARIAAAGFPVFRFDRRGCGDSAGPNGGFRTAAPDIAAALAAFRAQAPRLRRVVAYGNCDAASALLLAGGAGCDALVLANPWSFDPVEPSAAAAPAPEPLPPAALRRHYARRLLDPRAWARLLGGKVRLGALAGSLAEASRPSTGQTALAGELAEGLARFGGPATILIADNDRTGQAFLANWDRADPRLRLCPGASHSFVEPQARLWLQGQLVAALRG